MMLKSTIDHIALHRDIALEELAAILSTDDHEAIQYLYQRAHDEAQRVYGNKIFMRGLIELSNHCKNDCLYCGIRRSQQGVSRYRLTQEQILDCCAQGHDLGFRTFVMQGGEDA